MRIFVAAVSAGVVLLSVSIAASEQASAQQAEPQVSPEPVPPPTPAQTALPSLVVETDTEQKKKSAAKKQKSKGSVASSAQKSPAATSEAAPPKAPAAAVLGNLPPAYAGGQVATGGQVGLLGNRNFMDTPFNQTSYTSKLIQNQQMRTLGDVLANEPSANGAGLPRGAAREQPSIRGFGLSGSDIAINGLYGLTGSYSMVMFDNLERVEIFKGLSALVNGMSPGSGVGGAINFVTKRAGDEPLTEITTTYASTSQFGSVLDVGRRFGLENEFGVRFSGGYRDGNTEVDDQEQRLSSAALGLDYRGDSVRLSADLMYNNERDVPEQLRFVYAPAPTSLPALPKATLNSAQPWTLVDSENKLAMVQGEVDLNKHVTAYASVGASENNLDLIIAGPIVNNLNGNWSAVARRAPQVNENFAWQTGVRSNFTTGFISHQLNLSVGGSDTTVERSISSGPAVLSNIYNPVAAPNPNLPYLPLAKNSTLDLFSYGVADTLSVLNGRIQFTAGVRRQEVESASFNLTTGARTGGYDAGAWTPAYMLVVKPWDNVSLYANRIEGLQPGTVVGSTFLNAGAVFPPFASQQHEAGVKVEWGGFATTFSAFEITQPNLITLGTSPFQTQLPNGEQINRGIEINTFGELTESVRVLGGVAFIDPKLAKTQGGAFDGNTAVGVPHVQVNLGGEWDTSFVPGLTLTGRVIHTGREALNSANALTLPSWTRVDLGARYSVLTPFAEKPVILRFAVENVFDKNAWLTAAQADNQLFTLAPRTFLASMTVSF